MAAKKWQYACGKDLPITVGTTTKAFTEVQCKGEQHKDWPQYGKVVPEYFPYGVAVLGMMIRMNERPLLQVAASAGGAWAAATKPRWLPLPTWGVTWSALQRMTAWMPNWNSPAPVGAKIAPVSCPSK